MRLLFSLFLLLLLPLSLFAQESRRVRVPGTHCTLIPPLHFLASEDFAGFSSEEAGAAISVIDVAVPLEEMTRGLDFTREQGGLMKLKRVDSLTVAGKQTFIRVYAKKGGAKTEEVQTCFLGNAENALMVMATYEAEKTGLDSILREALLSARFDASLTANPEAAAPFWVDGQSRGFKPYLFLGTTLTYQAPDGWGGTRGEFKISSAHKAFTPDEKEAFLQTQIQGMSDLKMELTSMRPVTIRYLEGFELIGRATGKEGPAILHYTVLFQDDAARMFTLVGSASGRPKYWEKRFEALAQSFRLK